MLKFKKFTEKDLNLLKKYTVLSPYLVCDLSCGVMLMWKKHFNQEICVFNDTLIIKATYGGEKTCFFPPIGKDVNGAVKEIERYAVKNELSLCFSCCDESFLEFLSNKHTVEAYNSRKWSDYLYDITEMENFAGRKFGGQRNHINKFKKTYPNYKYKVMKVSDVEKIKTFLVEYAKFHKDMKRIEKAEYLNTFNLLDNFNTKRFVGGMIFVGKKLVAVSIGEYVGKMLVIHTEKALLGYSGLYPTMFNEFVKHNKKDGIIYVNRQDDAGDEGLRTSKTQYKPIKLVDKNFVTIKSPFNVEKKPIIRGEKVDLRPITKKDTKTYYDLNVKKSINKYWGYDYKKYFTTVDVDTFYKVQKSDFAKKVNLCLKIVEKSTKKMVGEVVLYNFDYENNVEIGFRLFTNAQGKGYAGEAVSLACKYIETVLKKTVIAKTFKINIASQKVLKKNCFEKTSEDKKYFYFIKKKI